MERFAGNSNFIEQDKANSKDIYRSEAGEENELPGIL